MDKVNITPFSLCGAKGSRELHLLPLELYIENLRIVPNNPEKGRCKYAEIIK